MSIIKPPFYLFMILVLYGPLSIDVFLPAIPDIAEALHAQFSLVQATVILYLGAIGIGQLLVGPLADRYGRRPMALGGIAIYGFAALLSGLANSIEILWLSRVIQGFGACAINVAWISSVRDTYGPERSSRIFSYLNGILCIIPALAPTLGSWLTDSYNWRASFIFMAGYAFIGWLIIFFALNETRPSNTYAAAKLIAWSAYKPVLYNQQFIFHVVFMTLGFAIILGYVTGASISLMVDLKLDMFKFSMWFASNAILNILGAVAAPKIIDKVGKRNALRFSSISTFVAACIMLSNDHMRYPIEYMGPVYISCIGFTLMLAVSAGESLAPFGRHTGVASGLQGLIQLTGASVLVGLAFMLPISVSQSLSLLMFLPMAWWLINSHKANCLFDT